ncbi:MAG TPA: SH3 domain-containing protein [Streptosporangiaceae bacterium]|nr:SH3 domain-containing protein [Streptosporangiaceae bacterium]
MGKMRVRTGMAFAVAGLATSGFALLSDAPAQAARVEATVAAAPSRDALATCWYEVIARSGLNVRKGPGTKYRVITTLNKGKHIRATCASSGWVKIYEPVTYKGKHIRGGWVARNYLKPHDPGKPKGGVDTGGGGTSASAETSSPTPATGFGLLVLGSGVAIAAWRRRATGAAPST